MAIRFKQKLCTMFIFVFMLLLFNTPNSGICATITVQTTIQAAIDSASNGDTIVVPDGIYSGPGNYNIDLRAKILTIESENGPENCVIDVGSPSTNGFNFDHPNESNCVLKGLTIQNGNFGIYIVNCSPTIENCTIKGNSVGGIFCINGSPSLIDCLISGNTGPGEGAGIYLSSSSPTIQNCVIRGNIRTGSGSRGAGITAFNGSNALIASCIIENNSCLNGGAGIYSYNSEITIKDCEIRNNTSIDGDGGGLLLDGSTSSIIDSKIIGNTAQHFGGGVYDISNGSSFVNCRFEKNKAGYGGGVGVFASSTFDSCWIEDNEAEFGGGLSVAGSAEFKNCIIVNNTASNAGGAAYVSSGTPKFMNCTVMMNTCTNASSPGGIRLASATLTNCILWANAPTQIDFVTSGTVTYSDVQGEGVFPGAGNINADPAVNAGTYSLRSVSPCIDSGTGTVPGVPLKDYAGDYRPRGVDFDIGAYEYSGVTPTDGQVLSKPHDFAPGATIKASEMNENFDVIYESVSQLKQVVCQDHPGLDFCQ